MINEDKLTLEQRAVIDSALEGDDGIYVVDSAAGSGKTTTAVEMVKRYIEANPNSRVLVLTRLREMRNKLLNKFGHSDNIECATVHSYAYKRFAQAKGLRRLNVLPSKVKHFQVIGDIKGEDESLRYVSANIIANLFDSYYANYKYGNVNDYALFLDKDITRLREAAKTVRINDNLVSAFQFIYTRMLQNNQYTHDMYVKEYAMNCSDITTFDLVVVDEAQDLSRYMSMLLDRIECKKLYLIGDEHQQLYSWDNCINIINEYKPRAIKVFRLTKSFRCNSNTLELSNHLLKYLETKDYKAVPVIAGHSNYELPENYTKATLFFTNSAMIKSAIETLLIEHNVKIQFKGFDNTSVKTLLGQRFTYILAFLELHGCDKLKKGLEDKYKIWCKNIPYILYDIHMSAQQEGEELHNYIMKHYDLLEPELRQAYSLYYAMMTSDIGIEGCLELLDENLKRDITRDTVIEDYSTVHRAKGFEWDYVVIGSDIWDFDTTNGFCTAYVGLTRASIKCDSSALLYAVHRYDEVKEYLDWTPTLEGYDGDLNEDLIFAKNKRRLREAIPTLTDKVTDEQILILCEMLDNKELPSVDTFDYSDIENITILIDGYVCDEEDRIIEFLRN